MSLRIEYEISIYLSQYFSFHILQCLRSVQTISTVGSHNPNALLPLSSAPLMWSWVRRLPPCIRLAATAACAASRSPVSAVVARRPRTLATRECVCAALHTRVPPGSSPKKMTMISIQYPLFNIPILLFQHFGSDVSTFHLYNFNLFEPQMLKIF